MATAAAWDPPGVETGTAIAAIPGEPLPKTVVPSLTARDARATSASGCSSDDVLATTAGVPSLISTMVSVRSVGVVRTSSWRSADSAAPSTGSIRSS